MTSSDSRFAGGLEQARTRAMISRAQAAKMLGVDVQRYSAAETKGATTEPLDDWLSALKQLHVGIDIDTSTPQSPAVIRGARIRAGLTKSEAASVVGLESGIGWHAYELGRYQMPAERWSAFLAELRSGGFRSHVTSSYRRGPRNGPVAFTPGRLSKRSKPQNAKAPAEHLCELLGSARKALRLSAKGMAEGLGSKAVGRVYTIEAKRATPTSEELQIVAKMLAERLTALEAMDVHLSSAADIAPTRAALRTSQDEVGRAIFRSTRPGAAIAAYEAGACSPTADNLESLSQFLVRSREDQVQIIREVLSRAR